MSVGIGGKLFGKGFEFYIGKRAYTQTLSLAKASVIAFKNFSLIGIELAIRW